MDFIAPRWADFWRPWIVAALLALGGIGFFSGIEHAHAKGFRHHRVHAQKMVPAHKWIRHHRVRARFRHARPTRYRKIQPDRGGFRFPVSHRGGDAVSIAMRYLGRGNPTGSHHAWCGDFVNMTERLAGRPGLSGGALASNWRFYGHVSGPVPGAIAVMNHHVSRVIKRIGDRVMLISGNYSRRVKIHIASIRSIFAFRMY